MKRDLPQFPGDASERLSQSDAPSAGLASSLSALFQFSIGLALVSASMALLLAPWHASGSVVLARVEPPFVCGICGLVAAFARLSPVATSGETAYHDQKWDAARGAAYAAAILLGGGFLIGTALGVALAMAFSHAFASLQTSGRILHSLQDNLLAALPVGAVTGIASAGPLLLLGGSPRWKAGRFFTSLGHASASLLESCVPKAVRHRPWIEAVLWLTLVAGPILWLVYGVEQ